MGGLFGRNAWLWCLVAVLIASRAEAVKFATNPTALSAFTGEPFNVDLLSLLSDTGSGGKLLWSEKPFGKPAWLTISSAEDRMFGNPTPLDKGTSRFNFVVQDGDTGDITEMVISVRIPPRWAQNPVTLTKAFEDKPYAESVAKHLDHPEATPVTFRLLSGPEWIALSPNGSLSGTPLQKHVGPVSLNIEYETTIDGRVFQEAAVFNFEVVNVNDPPVWSQSPIPLDDALEDTPYRFDVSPFASDEDGQPLTFSKQSGPAWVEVSVEGEITGTPTAADLGDFTVTILVSDGMAAPVPVEARGKVLNVNDPPRWTQDPVPLGTAKEDAPFSFSLASFAVDEDGPSLTFAKIGGPAWLTVASDGTLGGTPLQKDVGPFQASFSVTDGLSDPVPVTATGVVENVNDPPRWTVDPVVLADALEDNPYSFSIAGFVVDEDGDPLTFAKVSGPDWLSVAENGALSGTPLQSDVGDYQALFSVTDGIAPPVEVAARGTVKNTNDLPRWTEDPVRLGVAIEDTQYFFDLKTKVTDEENDPLTFRKVSGPAWLTLTPEGALGGTPSQSDVGDFQAVFSVADPSGTPVQVNATGTVVNVNDAPTWIQDPIALDPADEDAPYAFDVSNLAVDEDGDALTFSKVSGPDWITVSPTGLLGGTPRQADVGPFVLVIAASDGTAVTQVSANGVVRNVNDPPRWTVDPLELADALEDAPYDFDISAFAEDEDGDPLTFAKVSGPDWLRVSGDGKLSGTPEQKDVGDYTARFAVTDGKSSAVTVNANGRVLNTNDAPTWSQNPIPLADAFEDTAYSFSVASFASDVDGDALTFAKVSGPQWISVAANGALSGTPAQSDVGDYTLRISVSDGTAPPVEVDATGRVHNTNDAPAWTQNPIPLPDADEDAAYSFDLAPFVVDEDGDPLTFTIVSGPDWLTTTPQGKLSGTPRQRHVGSFSVEFQVSDGTASATARGFAEVINVNDAPVWAEDPLPLGTAQEDSPFAFDLLPKVWDEDGDPLTFKKLEGPDWLTLTPQGKLGGTPDQADVGPFTARFSVSDGIAPPVEVTANGTVVNTNDLPLWSRDPIPLDDAHEDAPYAFDVAPFASDPDGDALTFAKIAGPDWVQVSADGKLSGTPRQADVGQFEVRLSTTDGKSDPVEVRGVGRVLNTNDAPAWTKDPLELADATEDLPYAFDIRPFVVDEDGDPLTFAKVDGPAWLLVGANGKLSGTPAQADVGQYTARFSVTDGKSEPVIVTGAGRVLDVNDGPSWTKNPIPLDPAHEDQPYAFDVSPFATDPEGDPLTFSKKSGPEWLKVAPDGKLSGTPAQADVGPFTAVLVVSDGELSAEVDAIGEVLNTNDPPGWTQSPLTLPDATEDTPYSFALSSVVVDPDGDTLTFEKVSGPAWLSVAPTGQLSGTPTQADIGDFPAVFSVTDGIAPKVNVDAKGRVLPRNDPPVWAQNPIHLDDAFEDQPYQFDLSAFVSDEENDPLRFSKKSGPNWLQTTPQGQLMGTPAEADVGTYEAVFTVTDGVNSVDVRALGKVLPTNDPPYWTQDPLQLSDALEDRAYDFDLKPFAADPENDPLTFAKVSGPEWLSVTANGRLSGTPSQADVGTFTAVLSVTDGLTPPVEVTANGRVVPMNDPPIWSQNPIPLPDAFEDQPFSFDVSPFVSDEENDPLRFSKVSGPAWITVSPEGVLSGTPRQEDVGTYSVTLRVSDGTSSSTVQADGRVIEVNDPPGWTQNPIRLPDATEDLLYSESVTPFVVDPEGDPLSFRMVRGLDWLTMSTEGTLVGTPRQKDVGDHELELAVTDGNSPEVLVLARLRVLNAEDAPYWTKFPITLPDLEVGETLSFDISQFARDDDGDPLTFAGSGAPGWITVSPAGAIGGVPQTADIGTYRFQVTVTDGKHPPLPVDVIGLVVPPNRPPEWTNDPIPLADAFVDEAYGFDLRPFVLELDNDPLTFRLVNGPLWLTLDPGGMLGGTPRAADLGAYTAQFAVTDGKHPEVTVSAFGMVKKRNFPPQIDPLFFTIREGERLEEDLKDYIHDPENEPFTCLIIGAPSWVTVSNDCQLVATPQSQHVGTHKYALHVNDGAQVVRADLTIQVVRDPKPPHWTQSPIVFYAVAERPFVETLAGKAIDPSGYPLTFSKKSGPAWMTVAPNGDLRGTPPLSALGPNDFIVTVSNDAFSVDNTVIVHVTEPPITETVTIKDHVDGAESETLWVIDKAFDCTDLIDRIYSYMPSFSNVIAAKKLSHRSLMLNAQPKQQKPEGSPVVVDGSAVFEGTGDTFTTRIRRRLGAISFTGDLNSPVWSLHRFYQTVPGMSFFQTEYFESVVPQDVLIASNRDDSYRYFAQGTSHAGEGIAAYVSRFIDFHDRYKKPYRVSVIGNWCATTPYHILARNTGGEIYDTCEWTVSSALDDFADRVVARAVLSAQRVVVLSHKPRVATISITIDDRPISSATGHWEWDAGRNAVVIHFHLLPFEVRPGARIAITYEKEVTRLAGTKGPRPGGS